LDELVIHPDTGSPTLGTSDIPAWKRLITHAFFQYEVVPLIEAIFTSRDEVKVVCDLDGDDAQIFVNVIHEVGFLLFLSQTTD
jgi:hypothetical protein